ncbi:hypothetical protein C6B37_01005 [Candidatus Phytoplasma phoenicium]|uniref:Uncharacterized protein n=1 Tax=Candidatus Phytoplasma phoenicium TaxID=198422 RepID=A0A2S8NUY8_9MOLU|nr:hypothetical protein C6B37_01005 [Candidatus Phytoplasma phoenicium]
MKFKNYKKKNDIRQINKYLNQKRETIKTLKVQFFYLIKKRPKMVFQSKKYSNRHKIKIFLKQEINDY